MTPFLPGRRPEDPGSRAHARAIRLSAERLAEPLLPEEEAWLGGHLAACDACRSIAEAYESQALLLRSLPTPDAPRDLWARTSAAIEADRSRFRRRPSLIPFGTLAGALVVLVVVGASFLSRPAVPPVSPSSQPLPSSALASPSPGSTPLAVTASPVGYALQEDGTLVIAFAPIQQVCSADIRPDCPPLATASPGVLKLATTPSAILSAPNASQLVVVDSKTKTTGGAVYVVSAPSSAASPTPSPSPSPSGSKPPSSLSGSPSPPAASSSTNTGVLAIVSDVIVVGEGAAYSPDGRWFAFSARPADGSHGSDIYVWSPGDALAHPVTSDHRSVFAGWHGDHIIGSRAVDPVTGGDPSPASPSPSPDASPSAVVEPSSSASPSAGPSTGAASPTASGSADPNASSGPAASPGPIVAAALSFVLDPATGATATIPGLGVWRPVVDPTGTYAAYWQGTLRLAPDGLDWIPDAGHLVVARWTGSDIVPTEAESPEPSPTDASGPPAEPSASAEASGWLPSAAGASVEPSIAVSPSATAPSETASPSATLPPSPLPSTLPVALTDGPVLEWDIRWDETGTRFAVWLGDPIDRTMGSLTLHTLDRVTDTLDATGVLLDQQPSLPGFSIGSGRLAWATPPGQGGEGSRVEVLAWRGDAAGRIESKPGPGLGPVIVIR